MNEITPRDIEALLETFESSNWGEMKLKIDGLELFVSKSASARPSANVTEFTATPPSAPAPVAKTALKQATAPDHWIAVPAPNLGTFYRSPKPGAPPFVAPGQTVEPTTELCVIEVMKLFTSVFAGMSGTVRQLLIEDAELVEFNQPLFLIEPDA